MESKCEEIGRKGKEMKHPKIKHLCMTLIFGILLCVLSLNISNGWASECSNPKPEWVFYSCWDTAAGTSDNALRDGGKWGSAKYSGQISVVNNPPPGGPEPNSNTFRMHWTGATGANCSDGENNFVERMGSAYFPNPYFMRVYFYSEDPSAKVLSGGRCSGRKFFLARNNKGINGHNLALYEIDGASDPRMQIEIKNRNYSNYDYNLRTAERLTSQAKWPGKEGEGLILPNRWYCIEYGVYYHPTNGWIKAWLDGKLIINATATAFDGFGNPGSGYNTSMPEGEIMDGIQVVSYRNGGTNSDHYEYIDNFIISHSHIGPVGGGSSFPAAPTGLRIVP